MAESNNWQSLLSPYADDPYRAVVLAQQFYSFIDHLKRSKKGKQRVIAELEQAIEMLYEYSDFPSVSRELFQQRVNGTLKPKQERVLRELRP